MNHTDCASLAVSFLYWLMCNRANSSQNCPDYIVGAIQFTWLNLMQ